MTTVTMSDGLGRHMATLQFNPPERAYGIEDPGQPVTAHNPQEMNDLHAREPKVQRPGHAHVAMTHDHH